MDGIDPVARQEAAAWHARLQSRAVSNAELDEFYAWREQPEHARAFDAVETLWSRAAELRDDPDIVGLLRNAREPARKTLGMVEALQRGVRRRLVWTGMAALLAIGLLAFAVVSSFGDRTYRTGVGERLAVRLDDGSNVTLNTASRVSVRFSKGERDVVLEDGEAMFEVAHDAGRPFRVLANGTTVTAIGTAFQVARDGPVTRVVLVRGRIAVRSSAGTAPRVLEAPGDTFAVGGRSSTVGRTDPAASTGWMSGRIDLRAVPLEAAIAEVNRYTNRGVVLDAPAEARTRISGVFATGDPDAFAAAVEALLPLRRSRDQDGRTHLVERR